MNRSIDLALATVVAGVTCVAIAVSRQAGSEEYIRAPDALAFGLGAAIGMALLWRRRWPLGVLLASSGLLLAYYSLEYPGITPAVPLAVSLLNAALLGRGGWAFGVAGFWVTLGVGIRLIHLHESFPSVLSGMTEQAAMLGVTILLGQMVRSRAERAARATTNERLRMAREIHDVLGHTITAIGVQAALAEDVIDSKPQQARQALAAIRQATSQAVVELRSAMKALHGSGLAQLDSSLDVARRAGIVVRTDIRVPYPLPENIDAAALRIIQEAVTNTVRHAQAASLLVRIGHGGNELWVEVVDDGVGAPAGVTDHGLRGMAERVTQLRGTLETGPAPAGGFRVYARIPLDERR